MGCPELHELELYVTGRLSEQAAQSVDQHLSTCEACQHELAFAQALRLSTATPIEQPTSAHLTDEDLSALADGAMGEDQRLAAMAHIQACPTCAADLASVERAMDEALDAEGEAVMAPPVHLLNQAIRIGAPGRSASAATADQPERKGLLDRFFGAPLLLRLGAAAGVAALVLALTVVLSQPGPSPQPDRTPTKPSQDGPAVADAPRIEPGVPDTPPAPDRVPAPAPVVADGPDPGSQAADRPAVAPPSPAPSPAPQGDWLASLTADKRADLAGQARPVVTRPQANLGQALAEPTHEAGLSDGYVLGRALGFLDRFGPHVGKSAQMRGLVSETLLSLEPAIRSALPQGDGPDRLVRFAKNLGGQLAAGQIAADAAGRRLQVFCVALREELSGQANIRSGVQLGLLVQGWQTSANADQLGLKVPLQDAAALKRARQIIRTDQGLSDQMRRSVLTDLSQVEKTRSQQRGKQRAARILEEINRFDERVRATR